MRGQAGDYDRWAEVTGDPSWRWDQVLPLFKKSEDHHGGASDVHGGGGEWRVERQRLSWEILDAFREAAGQTGIPKVDDFNGGDNAGCAYFEVNQRRGIRLNTAKAFLKPAAQRPNLTIMTGCHVERLLIETTRQRQGLPRRAVHRRRTRLSPPPRAAKPCWPPARSVRRISCNCPASARPPAWPARHRAAGRLPGVGENLQDHLQLRMVYQSQRRASLNTTAASWFGKMKIGLQYAVPERADVDGAVAAGRLCPFRRQPGHAQPAIPRAAAVAGKIRRSAARFSGVHGQRLQPAPDLARPCAHRRERQLRAAEDHAELPEHAGRPQVAAARWR
jgi:choline dehydrogenase